MLQENQTAQLKKRALQWKGDESQLQVINQCEHVVVPPAAVRFDEYLAVTAAPPQENIITTL